MDKVLSYPFIFNIGIQSAAVMIYNILISYEPVNCKGYRMNVLI
jgi:hypothetical protein